MVREAFSRSLARAHKAKWTLSSHRIARLLLASRKRIVGQQVVAGVLCHDAQVGPANKLLQARQFLTVGEKVAAARSSPQRHELAVLNEHTGGAGCIRTVLQVVVATVQ